jgi:hypothetical protein
MTSMTRGSYTPTPRTLIPVTLYRVRGVTFTLVPVRGVGPILPVPDVRSLVSPPPSLLLTVPGVGVGIDLEPTSRTSGVVVYLPKGPQTHGGWFQVR